MEKLFNSEDFLKLFAEMSPEDVQKQFDGAMKEAKEAKEKEDEKLKKAQYAKKAEQLNEVREDLIDALVEYLDVLTDGKLFAEITPEEEGELVESMKTGIMEKESDIKSLIETLLSIEKMFSSTETPKEKNSSKKVSFSVKDPDKTIELFLKSIM